MSEEKSEIETKLVENNTEETEVKTKKKKKKAKKSQNK